MRELTAYEKTLNPIYEIYMLEKSGAKTRIYDTGKDSGFPDTGCEASMGFYYSLEDAIEAMHTNACDIRECVYDYGFVLRRMPGLYQSVGHKDRIYFTYDSEKDGFFEAEEPALLHILAY